MAGETTTGTADDLRFAAWITSEILLELRPMNVMRGFFRTAPAAKALAYDFPKQDDEAETAVVALTEAVDLTTNTELSTSKATATAAMVGVKATITDLLVNTSIIDALPHFKGVLSRTFAESLETDYVSLLDGFSNATTAATTLTLANHLAAIAALEQRDVTSALVAVYHPKQVADIRSDLTTQTGTYWGAEKSGGADLVTYQNEPSVVTLFGVPIFMTSTIPTTTGDKRGAIFARGEALGLYELWNVRTELERDASLLATEVVMSACFGTTEIDDVRGQEVGSDA